MTFTTTMKKKLSEKEESELDTLDQIEFQYRKTTKKPSFAELIDTFPEAIPTARRFAKTAIKEIKDRVSSLADFREKCSAHVQSVHFRKQPQLIAFYDELIDRLLQTDEKEIKKYQFQLDYLAQYGKPKTEITRGDPITPERIERARQYPITDLLEFKRGQALCPFHDDHKPSLKYYKEDNHVWCFSCAHRADAIDVAMKVWGLTFKEAVRRMAV